MANTRLSPEGIPIGDADRDLDYIPRNIHNIGVAATSSPSEARLDRREEFMDNNSWTPYGQAEVTLALKGLESEINARAEHGGLSAVEKLEKSARGYKTEALIELTTLRGSLAEIDDDESLSVASLRDDKQALGVLSKHQLFASALVLNKWPRAKISIASSIETGVSDLLNGSDNNLTALWKGAFASAKQRYYFWDQQLERVKNHPRIQESHREKLQHAMSR